MGLPRRQRGAVAILVLTALVLGIAWFAVGALGKAPVARHEREIVTGQALRAGKAALLAYVAQYAARFNTIEPGQMPCPESLTLANPGVSSTSCSAAGLNVGRLPWKTLGIDELRDGYGEPLWYIVRGFRNPPINFATAGQLTHNGSTVVAMIIAPGAPLNTAASAGTPTAGCSKQNQQVTTRNTGTLVPTHFLECGTTTGSITSPGDATWTNDRVISISAAEWADAIAGPLADRLQRQVAPAMNDFRTTTSLASWGESFFPNASVISSSVAGSQPENNDLCGDNDVRSGMPPTATAASGQCSTDWAFHSLPGLPSQLNSGGCFTVAGPPQEVRCDFTVVSDGTFSPRINLTAPRIGYSFRYVETSQITIQVDNLPAFPPYPSASIGNFASSASSSNGEGTLSFEVFLPFLTAGSSVRIRIPYPADALLADPRSEWFIVNGWDRFTHYGVSQAATHDPGSAVCNPGGTVTDCMTVNNMPSPSDDKRLVLVLMGRQLAGTAQPSYTLSDYWEGQNASADSIYEIGSVDATFNDRVAACPYTYTTSAGPVQPC
ncbi:MAG TPA: hypothetical protein VFC18_15030 [Burkholderiales bacterium]|nr:hypothetical protein [Burkholderiales bacterium]